MEKKSIEQLIYQETEERLKTMQDPSYEFPKEMTKTDYILIAVSCLISLGLIIACMVGGIQ